MCIHGSPEATSPRTENEDVHETENQPQSLPRINARITILTGWRPLIRWLVPSYWEERRDNKGLTRDWPDLDMPPDAPDWVRQLPKRRKWLEQEVVALDSRFGQFLEMEIQRAFSSSELCKTAMTCQVTYGV